MYQEALKLLWKKRLRKKKQKKMKTISIALMLMIIMHYIRITFKLWAAEHLNWTVTFILCIIVNFFWTNDWLEKPKIIEQ